MYCESILGIVVPVTQFEKKFGRGVAVSKIYSFTFQEIDTAG